MVNQDPAIPHTGLEWTRPAAARQCIATRMRAVLVAAMTIAIALALSSSARAATITVDSLADTGAPGICVLRDAITAATTMTATNGCVAGTGSDTINFSVTGTIALASTLPEVTGFFLTINGPPSPGITINGGGKVPVMMVAPGTTLNLNGLTIADGDSSDDYTSGGGIYNNGTLTVTNSTFAGNSAFYMGGGIYNNNNATLTVINSTFARNRTFEMGGGIFDEAKGGLIVSSTFSGNSAGIWGGGIFDQAKGGLIVTSSTFSGNSARSGGGIENFGNGDLIVTSSTFSGNTASAGVGGIDNLVPHEARVKNTILAGNVGGNCGDITDGGYNISDDATCNFSAVGSRNNIDPMLDPNGLRTNGGPTRTIALLAGSPAIDAIPLADCTDQASNPLITDQRGFPRPDAGEDFCDIGAYEYQDTAPTPFSWFTGRLTITSDTGVFHLASRFKLGAGGTIDPTTQPVAFGLDSYAVRLPAGSFVSDGTGYLYHGTNNGILLRMFIKPTDMPGIYALIAAATLTGTTNPVPATFTMTLSIGDNFGSTQINPTVN
jgi:hypothetical protein